MATMTLFIIITLILFYLVYLNSRYSIFFTTQKCYRDGILYIDFYAIIEDKMDGCVKYVYLFTKEKK